MTDGDPDLTRDSLQKLYDDWKNEHENDGMRELPKIKIEDSEYYVDGRLQEIRDVKDPSERVRFDEVDTMNRFRERLESQDREDLEPREEKEY